MSEEKNSEFMDLLKKRKQLSEANKKNIKTVSSNDLQLVDV